MPIEIGHTASVVVLYRSSYPQFNDLSDVFIQFHIRLLFQQNNFAIFAVSNKEERFD